MYTIIQYFRPPRALGLGSSRITVCGYCCFADFSVMLRAGLARDLPSLDVGNEYRKSIGLIVLWANLIDNKEGSELLLLNFLLKSIY